MTHFRTALLAFALLLPGTAWAQGHKHDHGTPAAAHGGVVAESSDHKNWIEMLIAGDRLTAWVSDEGNKPIPSARLGGKATMLVAGKREEVALAPGEGNSLTGKLAAAPAGKVTSVLALTIDGKPAQVRFAPR